MLLLPSFCNSSDNSADTLAPPYSGIASTAVGAVAEEAEKKKKAKHANLTSLYHFTAVVIETLGAFDLEANLFFKDLGHQLQDVSHDPLTNHQLLQ